MSDACCDNCKPPPSSFGKRALRLAWVTVLYNVLEGVVSVWAGRSASSIALVGFGLDSFVESLSGGVVIWRFTRGTALQPAEEERRERHAVRLIGWTFLILAGWVLFQSVARLVRREIPEATLLGIAIALVSLVAMPFLFWAKHRTGTGMGSRSVLADARQTLACWALSVALLAGLLLNRWWGLWWADPAVGILIGLALLREGREAVREGKVCAC